MCLAVMPSQIFSAYSSHSVAAALLSCTEFQYDIGRILVGEIKLRLGNANCRARHITKTLRPEQRQYLASLAQPSRLDWRLSCLVLLLPYVQVAGLILHSVPRPVSSQPPACTKIRDSVQLDEGFRKQRSIVPWRL